MDKSWVRVGSHLTVWVCLLVPSTLVLARGWTPLGDYAAIELRAYRSFSLHPPLVGMYSSVGTGVGHTVFDPGPLAFWLLAAPVHIDPAHGLIWGAALLWGLALSMAIEALWSSGLWLGCALVAFAMIDLLWAAPSLLENLAWNAYLPIPFLLAAIVMAFLIVRGRFGLWPILILCASVAAQTHILYFIPSIALVFLAPLLGLLQGERPTRLRWIAAGLGVAVACWCAPLIQALGPRSNVAALAQGSRGVSTLGFGFGFRLLGDSAALHPIWAHRAPTSFYPDMAFAFSHSTAFGIAVLLIMVVATALSLARGHRGLFAAGSVTVVAAVSVLISFSIIPSANLFAVAYLLVTLWIVGLLLWVFAVWWLISSGRWLVGAIHRRHPGAIPVLSPLHAAWGRAGAPPQVAVGAAVVALMIGGASLAVTASVSAGANFGTNWSHQEAAEESRVQSEITSEVKQGDVTIALNGPAPDLVRSIAVAEGVGWQLLLAGWHPGLSGIDPAFSGLPPIANSAKISIEVGDYAVDRAVEIRH